MTDDNLGIDSLPQCQLKQPHSHETIDHVLGRTIRLAFLFKQPEARELKKTEFDQLVPPRNVPGCLQNLHRADVCRALDERGFTVAGKRCV